MHSVYVGTKLLVYLQDIIFQHPIASVNDLICMRSLEVATVVLLFV
jgi:hypothetical protein